MIDRYFVRQSQHAIYCEICGPFGIWGLQTPKTPSCRSVIPLVCRLGSGVRVSASFKKKFPPNSVLRQQKEDYDLWSFVWGREGLTSNCASVRSLLLLFLTFHAAWIIATAGQLRTSPPAPPLPYTSTSTWLCPGPLCRKERKHA